MPQQPQICGACTGKVGVRRRGCRRWTRPPVRGRLHVLGKESRIITHTRQEPPLFLYPSRRKVLREKINGDQRSVVSSVSTPVVACSISVGNGEIALWVRQVKHTVEMNRIRWRSPCLGHNMLSCCKSLFLPS